MNGNKFNAWSLPQVNDLFFFCAWFTGNNKDIAFASVLIARACQAQNRSLTFSKDRPTNLYSLIISECVGHGARHPSMYKSRVSEFKTEISKCRLGLLFCYQGQD